METLAVPVTPDMKQRLEALAAATGKSLDQCLTLAIQEFVENWELHLSDIAQIGEDEARAVLRAANE